MVPILSRMNPTYTFPSYFPKIHSDIYSQDFRVVSYFQIFRPELWMHFLSLRSRYIPRQSQLPRFGHSDNVWQRVQLMKLFIMQCSVASSNFHLGPYIILSTSIYKMKEATDHIKPLSMFFLWHM
jgi:hypothetical protein